MYTIDLTVHEDRLERAVNRARERDIIIPTFAQMKDPSLIPDKFKEELERLTGQRQRHLKRGPKPKSKPHRKDEFLL